MIPNWSFNKFDLEDDASYLVIHKNSSGEYSSAHRAYWVEEEQKFYSLENNDSHPIIADFWMKLPGVS